MAAKKQEIDELKTEIIGLKVRIRRIEDFLCSIPSAEEYIIYETGAEDELFEEAKKVVLNYDLCSASLLQRELEVGYARAARILDELERAGIVGKGEGGKPRKVLIPINLKKKSKK